MNTRQQLPSQAENARPKRKLRPEIAARLTVKNIESELAHLYAKPLTDLTPDELRKMKAAFLLGI